MTPRSRPSHDCFPASPTFRLFVVSLQDKAEDFQFGFLARGQRTFIMYHRQEDPLADLVKIDPKSIGVGQYSMISAAQAVALARCVGRGLRQRGRC
jgi:hypothetical protein